MRKDDLASLINIPALKNVVVKLSKRSSPILCSAGVVATFAAFWGTGFSGVDPKRLSEFLNEHCSISLCGQILFCDSQGTKFFMVPIPIQSNWKLLLTEGELDDLIKSIFNNFRSSPDFMVSVVKNFSSGIGRTTKNNSARLSLFKKIMSAIKEESQELRDGLLGFGKDDLFVGKEKNPTDIDEAPSEEGLGNSETVVG